MVARALAAHGIAYVAIESDHGLAAALRADGVANAWGDATRLEVLRAARPDKARLIVLAMPDAAGCRMVMERARAANPEIGAAARAHDDADAEFLTREAGVGLAAR